MTIASQSRSTSIKDFVFSLLTQKSQDDSSRHSYPNSNESFNEFGNICSGFNNYSNDSMLDSSFEETDNPNLWNNKLVQWTEELSKKIQDYLTHLKTDIKLKFSEEFIKRLSREIATASLKEPCGIRGCSIHLRLLHEDVANVLMTPIIDAKDTTNHGRRCASWPDAPKNFQNNYRRSSCQNNALTALNFKHLPEIDTKLTRKFSADVCSTDSGFYEKSSPRRRKSSLVKESSTCLLSNLSAASAINVPCADLGHLKFDPNTVPNFEIYVYFAPVTSWSWKVKRFFASTLARSDTSSKKRKNSVREIPIVPDFTLVKRKLFRSRRNSIEVIPCPSKS